jgi:hypothetical protein
MSKIISKVLTPPLAALLLVATAVLMLLTWPISVVLIVYDAMRSN